MTKKWKEVLDNWENGNIPKMPDNIKKPFIWRTSAINNKKDLPYKEEFIEDKRLYMLKKQDLITFKEYFLKKKNINEKNAISFYNLSKDTILVVPVARTNKKFTNLYYFMKNASLKQQKELWKKGSIEAKKMLKKFNNI